MAHFLRLRPGEVTPRLIIKLWSDILFLPIAGNLNWNIAIVA